MDNILGALKSTPIGTQFQIYSGILKATRSADGKMRLHGVASSTTKDLHGDTMESSALEDMERSANGNLTIFLNHSYEVPEDVAGSVELARMKTRDVDHEGNPNVDLDMDILVNDSNPRAVKTFEAIERGTKLGLSIGALIPTDGAVRDKKSGTYQIQHIQLLETSLVGIPANPRSWVEYAAKSLRATDAVADAVVEGLDATAYGDTNKVYVVAAAGCPTCGKSKDAGGCSDNYHKDVTPDVTDATVNIQIDTDDGSSSSDAPSSDTTSQEGPLTDPESDTLAADAAPAIVDGATWSPAVERMLDLLRTTSGELVTARAELTTLAAERDRALSARDEATRQRDDVLAETQRVLNKVADTPLMRRAVAVEAGRELASRFEGYYSEAFLKMLEK